MKNVKNTVGALLVLLAVTACNNEESNIQTEIKIPVSVTIIKPESISRFIETTGTVYSSKEGAIKSELTGIYRLQTNPATGRPFALGDAVRQGQVIIRLEDKEFEKIGRAS
ncbi:MAG: efflux transporter periplasmic adaptor subunit, partial [Imperialibacter sp.]